MKTGKKEAVKRLLGDIPLTAELYWLVRQKDKPIASRYILHRLQQNIDRLVAETLSVMNNGHNGKKEGKKIFIFASLHYWIEQTAVTALGLVADGNTVTLGYYPYCDWFTDQNKFDLRRQNIYTQKVLRPAADLIHPVSFLTHNALFTTLPAELHKAVKDVSIYDTQYTLQIEEFEENNPTYQFRLKRNTEAAQSVYAWLRSNRPDVVVVPNGTIQEFGIVYRVARFLKIPVSTYEFSDQKDVFWLGHNQEIMQQDTTEMWQAKQDKSLTNEEMKRVADLFHARQKAQTTGNFTRQWQNLPAQGGESVRDILKLNDRPVVLLATNVLGDSLTLGRHDFSKTMADWVIRTIQYFIGRPDIQLIIRIHPGELLSREYSMVDVVRETLPELPEYIHVIHPEEKINTYDLVDLADVGLVYTTTVGLEMALRGIPVVVAGKTHYRDRGFTYDPHSWVDYFKTLGRILEQPQQYRLPEDKIKQAWKYAYHFFFTFQLPFPWHFKTLFDAENHSIEQVFDKKTKKKYEDTFRYLAGEPIDWSK